MNINQAFANATAAVVTVPEDAVNNGVDVFNTATVATSHVRERAKWVVATDGGMADLQDAVAWMAQATLDKGAHAALAAGTFIAVELAVILALVRAMAWRMFGMTVGRLQGGEVHRLAAGETGVAIHADWTQEVVDAVGKWTSVATRMVGIAWYNALSLESVNHHHLPVKTKKLYLTTASLLGITEWLASMRAEEAEGIIMHDMFHPLGFDIKAALARNTAWAKALANLNFMNLYKRIPVKAADCGLAFNYRALHNLATGYVMNAGDIPESLSPPDALLAAIATYTQAANDAAARAITAVIRAMSAQMGPASAYLMGYVVGKERRAASDPELEVIELEKRITILGSPAIKRTSGEFAPQYALGLEKGFRKVSGGSKEKGRKKVNASINFALQKAVEDANVVRLAIDPTAAPYDVPVVEDEPANVCGIKVGDADAEKVMV